MKIQKLKLLNFRKFKERSFDFQENFNVIIGKNGTGKTSLLEAMYIISSGKSFVTNHIFNCISFSEEYFFIEANFNKKEAETNISFLLGQEKKELRKDGKRLRGFIEVVGDFPFIVMNYSLVDLVMGSPEDRREFINHALIFLNKDYYKELVRFYALLEKRNAHLKSNEQDLSFIKVISEEMLTLAVSISQKRSSIIKRIEERLPEVLSRITGNTYSVSLIYNPSMFENLLKDEYINEEINKKRTLFGIHLDEIALKINGKEAREFSSLGEAYSLAFAMRFLEKDLIKEDKNDSPVLLLDDFFTDLDESRRENVLKLVKDEQVFITATSPSLINDKILASSKVIIIQ